MQTLQLTLEYWRDDGGFVGRLRELPGIFSQGRTLAELEDNIRDAYQMVVEDASRLKHPGSETKTIELPS